MISPAMVERFMTQTLAMFLLFLAGALPDAERVRRILAAQLLDPSAFFGEYPFPSVAYDDPDFAPAHWWRGPVWPPIEYLCLELLVKFGFHAERREAARRLYSCVIRDGRHRAAPEDGVHGSHGRLTEDATMKVF